MRRDLKSAAKSYISEDSQLAEFGDDFLDFSQYDIT